MINRSGLGQLNVDPSFAGGFVNVLTLPGQAACNVVPSLCQGGLGSIAPVLLVSLAAWFGLYSILRRVA